MVPGGHGRHRDAQTAWSVPRGVRHQHGCCNCEPRRLCDGSKRGINRLPPETTVCPIPRRVVRADDERFPRSEHIPSDAFGDAPLRGFDQRFASDENRPRRGSPVHAFRSRPIRLEFSGEDGWRVFGAVRRFRPDHRAAVTPRHHEKPFPRRRRAIVASPEFPPVNAVAEPPQPPNPRPERRPGLCLDRLAVGIKRPHVWNSSTFSNVISLGRTSSAHRTTTHARSRMCCERGFPPLAFEKCVQSGEACSTSTGWPPVAYKGLTASTLAHRCSVPGWFAACMANASASWLIAISGEYPSAHVMPVLAPPPPAKRSMIRPQGMAHLSSIHYLPMLHLENWQRGCLRLDTFLDFSYPVLQHHCNVSTQLPYLCLTYGQDPKTTCRTLSGRIRYCSCPDCFLKEANSQQKKIPQRNTFPAIDRVL